MRGNDKQTQNRGGMLKTTTWGALIAFSLLVTAWGFNGRWTGSKQSTTVAQNVAQPSLTASKATKANPSPNASTSPAPSKQSSALGSLFDSGNSHDQNAPVAAAKQSEAVAAGSFSPLLNSADTSRQQPQAAASSGPSDQSPV